MALEIALTGVALFFLLIFVSGTYLRQKHTIPTVQPCLPFFGNALHIDTGKCHLVLSELSKKYGSVYFFQLFKEKILVLNDFSSIYDALIMKPSDFAGRPDMFRTSNAERNKHSIVWQTYTQKLMFLRKSVQKCFRMYGAGLGKLEQRCLPDILHMCKRLRDTEGKAVDPWNPIYDSVCSVMLYLTLGSRFEYSSASFQRIKEINELFNDTFGSGKARYLDFIPLLRMFRGDAYCRMQKALQLRDEFWNEQLFHMKTSKVDPDCVVWSLLEHIKANTDTTSADESLSSQSNSKAKHHHQDQHPPALSETTVKEVFTNLILAGTDTTATALTCFLLVLLHHPHLQQELQQEVDGVLGGQSPPSLAYRPLMPKLEAALLELLRYISHVPLAVPHLTMCDTSILGRFVPANTTVYINLWSLHHDEREWTDPWRFNPSRFLDNMGKLMPPGHENRRKLLPFGAGRRVCLGEVLAKNRLFLFAASLVQQFHFEPEDTNSLPDLDPRNYQMGLVLHPKPFRLCAIPRHSSDTSLTAQ